MILRHSWANLIILTQYKKSLEIPVIIYISDYIYYIRDIIISPNSYFYYYFYFITERMNIFWNKLNQQVHPRTTDPILSNHKFTNAYRVLDRESQYLISQIINPFQGTPEDLILQVILYKIFNKSQTREQLLYQLGKRPTVQTFDVDQYTTILTNIQQYQPIFNNAYMMTGATSHYQTHSKHETWLTILKEELIPLIPKLLKAQSLQILYELLRQITFFGPFIAMQYSIDLNYTPIWKFDESQFIVAGIGARRGINKCFDEFDTYENVIHWTYDNFQQLCNQYKLQPKLIPGLPLHLIDIQSGFCETDKYLRAIAPSIGKPMRIKQSYSARMQKTPIMYEFPHWRNINLVTEA